MADKAWKQFERDAAALIGGKRKWANSGERLDIESDYFIGQCKLVKVLSLAQLNGLAVEMQREGDKVDKFGVVVTKFRAGSGNRTPMLVTMTAEDFRSLFGGMMLATKRQIEEHINAHEALEAPPANGAVQEVAS